MNWRRFFWKKKVLAEEDDASREIHLRLQNKHLNDAKKFAHNRIRTSKYSILTFLPLNLFEQFHRLANLYFLLLIVLNWIPQLNVFGKEVSMFPLIAVVLATMIKDMYEDYTRHKSDNEVNNRQCLEWTDGKVVSKLWKSVKVGDVVKIEMEKPIPADVVILSTSNPEQNCYVSTMNLDGETNLKVRKAAHQYGFSVPHVGGHTMWDTAFDTIVCETPHENIYKFTGYITRKTEDGTVLDPIPLDAENLLLRGCILKNTQWALGAVVYAGHETKSMLNNKRAPSKRNRLEREMNKMVLWLILLLIIVCLITGVLNSVWMIQSTPAALDIFISTERSNPYLTGFLNFLSSIIVYQVMIPIALYITMDVVNLIQVYFINRDLELYHVETDTPMLCRALNIHSDLGQTKFIFSDKTGTLTCNRQTFNQCSIKGVRYSAPDVDGIPYVKLNRAVAETKDNPDEIMHYYLLTLAMCNTAMIDVLHPHSEEGIPAYQSESPDEIALINAAAKCGYVMKSRSADTILIDIHGEEKVYRILAVLPFNSDRKRMAVMLRDEDSKVLLLTKGADEIIYQRLAANQTASDHPFYEETRRHLNDFSIRGLRTLCLAYRICEEREYESWVVKFSEASGALEQRDTLLDELYSLYEKEYILLGATAVEDRLQDMVPETISTLYESGTSIWVLTGDMQNTAVNVAYACNLLNNEMEQFILGSEHPEECAASIEQYSKKIDEHPDRPSALIIHGRSLTHTLSEAQEKKFYDFVSRCKIVICCRVSPLQKALVVNLVRKYTNDVTLAIGDGANDVGMIQAAHVGVGINGQEGRQAVMSSDFAIAQFRFLRDLILVHGHWSYYRLSNFIFYFLYKNALFVMILFWYQVYDVFSNQTPIGDIDLILYGVLYTNLPIIVFAIFDQDIPRRILVANPWLHKIGMTDSLFSQKLFGLYMLDMLYQSVVMTYFPVYAYYANGLHLYTLGTPILTSCVIGATLHLALDTHYWTWFHHAGYWLSALGFIAVTVIFNTTPGNLNYNEMQDALGQPIFYLTCLFTVVLSLLPRFVIKAGITNFFPDLQDQAREFNRYTKLQNQQKKVITNEETTSNPQIHLSEKTSLNETASKTYEAAAEVRV